MNRINELHSLRLLWLTTLIFARWALIGAGNKARANDGEVVTAFAPKIARVGNVSQIFVQPDGKILVNGSFTAVNGAPRSTIARFNADGTLDVDFVPAALSSFILLQPDGKILLRGNAVRLNSDGTPDTTFKPKMTNYLAVLPDGKIVATEPGIKYATGLSRLAANGDIEIYDDYSSVGLGVYIGRAVAQSDGKVIFANGFFNYDGVTCRQMARLNADWSLDRSFTMSDFLIGRASEIVPLPGGKIYVAGYLTNTNPDRFGFARLNADGSLDSSFNPPAPNGLVSRVIPLPDGKLLIAGSFTDLGGAQRSRIARLNEDGSLDTTFDPRLAIN